MKNKKILILIALVMMISLVGISYAFFEYYKEFDYQVTAGEVTLNFNEGTNTINLTNIFPETKQEARARKDNFITFTISGANTTTNKDIWYEIMLNNGDEETGKTRFDPNDLSFDLSEVLANGNEVLLLDGMSFSDFNEHSIWVDTIYKNTKTTSTKTYKLRMWLSGDVIISDTETNADYTSEEFRNRYASVKVSVYGDFEEKDTSYTYMARFGATFDLQNGGNFWPDVIVAEQTNIKEINFIKLDKTTMQNRYDAATIKADVTDTTKRKPGSVLVWLETNEDDSTKYTMYVASDDIIYFPQDCSGMFYGLMSLESIQFDNIDTRCVTNMAVMFGYCQKITNLDLRSFETGNVTNMSAMFLVCNGLNNLNISSFDTSQVTDMSAMFGSCLNLPTVDVSGWDTSNVTNMSHMFSEGLFAVLDVSSWDTSKVTDMSMMFYFCNVTSLDVSNWNTSNVTNMASMFVSCTKLTALDVSNWDTSNVESMMSMFNCCYNLASLDVSSFDTSKITSMSQMFSACGNLTILDVSGWDTSSVTDMYEMFSGCSGLISLDVSGFDTSKVTNMSMMFYGCSGLTSLDISSFDISNLMSTYSMFSNCSNLTTIYSSADWNTGTVTSSTGMFQDCSKLVGAVPYDSTKTDITMANPITGYFTVKPAEETTTE